MTNVVTYESGVFVNADGLRVKYGQAETLKGVTGTVADINDERLLFVDLDWNRLPAFGADNTHGYIYGSEPEDAIPTGAFITSAVLQVDTAFAGSSSTLTIGLVDRNGATLSLNNGILSAEAVGSLTPAGTLITCAGSAVAGAAMTVPSYIWVSVGTANFTAGAARLKLIYNVPRVAYP